MENLLVNYDDIGVDFQNRIRKNTFFIKHSFSIFMYNSHVYDINDSFLVEFLFIVTRLH